jgi:hypothetical protein
MPDGTVIKGAQGNFPFDPTIGYSTRALAVALRDPEASTQQERQITRMLFSAPWMHPDPAASLAAMSYEQILSLNEAIPAGVLARHGTSLSYPAQVPDLIGVKDRKYLDHTGLVKHRGLGDLMRYAALNQDGDMLSRYGDFRPIEVFTGELPPPGEFVRYSDEQLYALGRYIYSLKPPPNPNKFGALAAKGQRIFQREGCPACHTPPLYTNNKLTPVEGFAVPQEHYEKFDILAVRVGTDPQLALGTRRGTGYYKVPSLKGLWYRGPLEHNGSVATLEDWFDPRRLRKEYVPTGFRRPSATGGAVKGHPFGLGLSSEERKALIAFLKTL